jgi:hypothetical protein
LYSLLNIDRLIKSRRVREVENVVGMGEKRKRPLVSPRLLYGRILLKWASKRVW